MTFNSKSTIIGLVLLCLYVIQFVFKLEWHWLFDLQQEEMYKRWSGLALALLITFQWILTLTRVVKKLRKYAFKMTAIHKWLGALSPLFFYVHSMGMGYGYLLLLSYLFLANVLLGCINLDVIKNKSDWVFKSWMIMHVVFSIIITTLMFLHIGVVFYYK
jgi:sulfoxide reductase heme-binding subunit YedZ